LTLRNAATSPQAKPVQSHRGWQSSLQVEGKEKQNSEGACIKTHGSQNVTRRRTETAPRVGPVLPAFRKPVPKTMTGTEGLSHRGKKDRQAPSARTGVITLRSARKARKRIACSVVFRIIRMRLNQASGFSGFPPGKKKKQAEKMLGALV